MLVAILVAIAVLSAVLTWLMREVALRRRLLDLPTPRSSHSHPTPRLGGVAIAATVIAGIVAVRASFGHEYGLGPAWQAFIVGGVIAAAIGLADDLLDLPPAIKLAGELASLIPVWMVVTPQLGFGPAWLALAVWTIVAAGYMNLFNFLDGSDGLAAGVAVVNAAALAFLAGGGLWTDVSLILGAAAIGFLAWNYPPASVFMGDAGSLFLGYGFAIAGAMMIASGVSAVAVAIALAAILCDGTLTLITRLADGKRIWEAHRSHLYQRLMVCGWSHREVARLYWAWAAISGVAAVAYHRYPGWPRGAALAVSAAALAGIVLLVRQAEARDPRP